MKATVNLLRKQGQLKEAYFLAQKQMNDYPEELNHKNDMLWVYYDFAKEQVRQLNYENVWKIMKQLCELDVADNQMFNDSFNWQLVKLISKTQNDSQGQPQLLMVLKACYKMLQKQVASQSKSVLIKSIIRQLKTQAQSWQLLNFLDFNHYRKEDFFSETYQGKRMMPLYEQMLYSFMKNWLLSAKENNKEAMAYLPALEKQLQLIGAHYSFKFLNYYFAQLYLLKQDKAKANEKALLFLKKNKDQSWAWELLAKSSNNQEEQVIYLSKALVLQHKPAFRVGIMQSLINIMLQQKDQDKAICLAQQLMAIRQKEGWSINSPLSELVNSKELPSEFKKQVDREIEKNADKAIISAFNNAVSATLIVSGKDERRSLYFLISPLGKQYRIKDKRNFLLGQLLMVTIIEESVFQVKPLNNKPMATDYIKTIKGKLKKVRDFGFIGDAFVSPAYLKHLPYSADVLRAIAIKEQNPKTKKQGWRVLKIYASDE